MITDLAMEWPESETPTPVAESPSAPVPEVPGDSPVEVQAMSLSEILDSIRCFLQRFVFFPNPAQPVVVSLWLAHTWVKHAFAYTPYLHIFSPEKRCGKSRLLECLELFSENPWPLVSPTAAVMFRKIEQDCPTVLLDEVDTVFKRGSDDGKEALRAVLNAGFQRHAKVARCCGDNHELKEFRVFCPKAIAGIGSLPDTIADRCIPIQLARRSTTEHIDRFRSRDVRPLAEPIIESLKAWSSQPTVIETLRAARPRVPDALGDRQADICEPLIAIAELAGGDWPDRARTAIVLLCTDEATQDESLGVKLLSDIRRVFGEEVQLPSYDLLHGLTTLETDAPWALWWADALGGNLLSVTGKLARMLTRYGISSQTIRTDPHHTIKGYRRERFEEAWARYCPTVRAEPVTPAPD